MRTPFKKLQEAMNISVIHKESTPVYFQESTKADFLLNSSLSRLCREERCNYNIYIEFDEVLFF